MSASLNLYKRWMALFPAPAVQYGQVVSSGANTVSVRLANGSPWTLTTTETWADGSWVWIRQEPGGWTLSAAPALPFETIEV